MHLIFLALVLVGSETLTFFAGTGVGAGALAFLFCALPWNFVV